MRRSIFILLCGLVLMMAFPSCKAIKLEQQKYEHKRRLKHIEKEKLKREEEEAESYRQARERHMEIQSRSAIREMKRNQRKSMRYNANKKDPFYERWFRKSPRNNRPQGSLRK
jgi:hypothetical protein